MNADFSTLYQTQVLSQTRIQQGAFVLKFNKDVNFKAGQVLAITTHHSIAPRLYSILSGENEEQYEILYDVKHGGMLTPKLSGLKEGDTLFISKPFGQFLYQQQQPAWFIATGTGIAPFISMCRSYNLKDIRVIQGARLTGHFYFQEYLSSMFDNSYIRCCSGEQGPGLVSSRLTNYLQQLSVLPLNNLYYLCGAAEMVVETRDILIGKGIAFENIKSEIYF
ncbi:MAG: oxidoreductase [Bacteroidales bacterium]|nr:oxidoreductase [Bacteroidales bacterium]